MGRTRTEKLAASNKALLAALNKSVSPRAPRTPATPPAPSVSAAHKRKLAGRRLAARRKRARQREQPAYKRKATERRNRWFDRYNGRDRTEEVRLGGERFYLDVLPGLSYARDHGGPGWVTVRLRRGGATLPPRGFRWGEFFHNGLRFARPFLVDARLGESAAQDLDVWVRRNIFAQSVP